MQYYISLDLGKPHTNVLTYSQSLFQQYHIKLQHHIPVSIPKHGLMQCVSQPVAHMDHSLEEDLVQGRSRIRYKGHLYTSTAVEQIGTSPVVYITYAPYHEEGHI